MTDSPDPITDLDLLDEDDEDEGYGLGLAPDPITTDIATLRGQRAALADAIATAVVSFKPRPTAPPAWAHQGD